MNRSDLRDGISEMLRDILLFLIGWRALEPNQRFVLNRHRVRLSEILACIRGRHEPLNGDGLCPRCKGRNKSLTPVARGLRWITRSLVRLLRRTIRLLGSLGERIMAADRNGKLPIP